MLLIIRIILQDTYITGLLKLTCRYVLEDLPDKCLIEYVMILLEESCAYAPVYYTPVI